MTRHNNYTQRNYRASAWDGQGMPPAVPQRMPEPPAPYGRRSYSDGFCDGFCEGVGKFLGLAVQAVPVIRNFR